MDCSLEIYLIIAHGTVRDWGDLTAKVQTFSKFSIIFNNLVQAMAPPRRAMVPLMQVLSLSILPKILHKLTETTYFYCKKPFSVVM